MNQSALAVLLAGHAVSPRTVAWPLRLALCMLQSAIKVIYWDGRHDNWDGGPRDALAAYEQVLDSWLQAA